MAKVYRNMGRVSVRELQTLAGEHWCAEWKNGSYTLTISNGAALPTQTAIEQHGTANTRGSLIVDAARSERLIGATATAFLSTHKAHDILLEDTGFKYMRLKESLSKMKGRFPNRFTSVGLRRAHHKSVFKKVAAK